MPKDIIEFQLHKISIRINTYQTRILFMEIGFKKNKTKTQKNKTNELRQE